MSGSEFRRKILVWRAFYRGNDLIIRAQIYALA